MLQGSVVKSNKKSSWVNSEEQEEELMGVNGQRWKKASNEEVTVSPPDYAVPRSSYIECQLEASPAIAKRAKKKLHTVTDDDDYASDLVNDKVLVEHTKKELSGIHTEQRRTTHDYEEGNDKGKRKAA
ncbi:hypothetical protein GUJ93_ZPchr0001g32226 [Zizania palustris]|uniref:Uncharacterized protein n=1 Tax=Zizania palustris TaxID=103762 RepID=A0A8J5RPY4_ZIZPA|nr:hypothetical protein GUJ93_ZPchr0001g32226 [Zizania palustris]